MRAEVLCVCLVLFFAVGTARGQQPDQDPIGQSFFAPELVIQHQEAIGLSAEQKDSFKAEIRQAQLKFTELQWKLQDEMEKLIALVKQPRVDEQQALAQLDKVLAAEREVKKEQVTLLVRIKNKLTPEQQSKLAELRGKPATK
jgi:Spy/CpxP family protein refolding chaperone